MKDAERKEKGESARLAVDDDLGITQFAKNFGLTHRQAVDLVESSNGDLAAATLKYVPSAKVSR